MVQATVLGNATATAKHRSMEGWRMLVVQPLGNNEKPDGNPLLVIDALGAARGDRIIISSDGKETRRVIGHPNTPARWIVVGIVDPA